MKRRGFFALVVSSLVLGSFLNANVASGRQVKLTNRFAPSGVVSVDPLDRDARPFRGRSAPVPQPTGSSGCPDNAEGNVRANQACTNQAAAGYYGRSQSQNETAAAVNPTNPDNVILGQNDYRDGDGHCGVDWSLDGGKHWGSQLIPMTFTAPGFTALRHYWDAGGDPTVAFNSAGRAFYVCLQFDRGTTADFGDSSSGIFLYRSLDGGASWSFPGVPISQTDGTGEDGIGLIDKQYMAIDTSASSPYLDRIYVSWSNYSFDFTADPIHLAYSDDDGLTWTQAGAVSGFSEELCPINFDGSPPGTCNANQFSVPFTAPNGDVHVVFQNFNNCAGAFGPPCEGDPRDNHNQMLVVTSTDGGATFGAPVKVADFFDLPDCYTYTGENFFRGCVPTAPLTGTSVFRATNYPSPVVLSDGTLVVDFGSYINPHSNSRLGNCVPAGFSPDTGLNLYTGVGVVNGCNNDIVRSISTDGGASFTGTTTPVSRLPSVSRESGTLSDQWWQWTAVNAAGSGVATAFYDRRYGDAQESGFMDISMATPGGAVVRVTNASFPPSNEFPGINGYSTFMGDYMGLAVGSDNVAHPVWTDSRNPIYSFNATTGSLVFAGYGADAYTRSLSTG